MPKDRMRRVNEAVREVLSVAITSDLKDPRIGFVTVTAVDTSPDLRHAHVYVSVLGDERDRDDSLKGLRSSRGYLQWRVASAPPSRSQYSIGRRARRSLRCRRGRLQNASRFQPFQGQSFGFAPMRTYVVAGEGPSEASNPLCGRLHRGKKKRSLKDCA